MKRILYLSFSFEPDFCAGPFRNSPLVKQTSEHLVTDGTKALITTVPSWFNIFNAAGSLPWEKRVNLRISTVLKYLNTKMLSATEKFKREVTNKAMSKSIFSY